MTANVPTSLQRLLDEAPFVRLLARTLLADEADEVVQQTWLHAVRHGGAGVAEPRSWLARIARNVANNLRRGDHRRRQHEDAAAPATVVPSSAELMAREEQRHALVRAVDGLPPPLRTVVLLRFFDGLPPRRIAKRLGVPVATVWNQQRRALQLLREQLDAAHGGQRRAWLLPLVPFAMEPRGLPLPDLGAATMAALGTGAMMTMKTKVVTGLAVAVVAAAAVGLWLANDGVPHSGAAPNHTREAAAVATAELPASPAPAVTDAPPQRTEVVPAPAPAAATTGSLVVHVRWGDDKTPAAGITIRAATWATDTRVDGARAVTDESGTVRFDELVPQPRLGVKTDRFDSRKPTIVEIRAGETTDVELELPVGLLLTGIVVDAAQAPVAGALIEIAPLGTADDDAATVATSGADGRFSVRGAPTTVFIGARAGGHGASRLQYIHGKDGNTADVRLQLEAAGGIVDGVVVDERGNTIAGAVVRIGRGATSGIVARGNSAPPLPAQVRTDAQGRFRAIGVPPGEQPVAARSAGRAPWRGTCEVTANLTTPLRIELAPGASVRGIVRNAAGDPAKADINVGEYEDLGHHRVHAGADGRFEIDGLPAGDVVLVARNDEFGRAEHRVRTEAGDVVECEVRLSTGIELRGRVEDDAGKPVKTLVECMSSTPPIWAQHTRTDDEGRFTVRNCPEGEQLTLNVRKQGFEELRRDGVVSGGEPVRLQLRRTLPPSARITGIVVDAGGKPVQNATVIPFARHARTSEGNKATGPDGRFECGPLVPGSWTVHVRSSEHPTFRSEALELAADAVRDLGTIVLPAAGRAEFRVDGDATGVVLSIADAAGLTAASLPADGDVRVSGPLAPGAYRVRVFGKTTAAQMIPITVRAGETTNVAVTLATGVQQRVEIAPLAIDPLPQAVRVSVLRAGEMLAVTGFVPQAGKPSDVSFCLPLGDYSVRATIDEREIASATFSVGERESPPVRLTPR